MDITKQVFLRLVGVFMIVISLTVLSGKFGYDALLCGICIVFGAALMVITLTSSLDK